MVSRILCYAVMFGALRCVAQRTWTLKKLERKYLENFEMCCWRKMENIKWSEKITNEQVIDRIGERRTLINNILCRKVSWMVIFHERNFLLHDVIQGQIMELKGIGGRITQLLEDLRNKRYSELQEEAEDRKRWKGQFMNRTWGRNKSYLS